MAIALPDNLGVQEEAARQVYEGERAAIAVLSRRVEPQPGDVPQESAGPSTTAGRLSTTAT